MAEKRSPGRPRKDDAKRNKTLRLSPDVIALIDANPVTAIEDALREKLSA